MKLIDEENFIIEYKKESDELSITKIFGPTSDWLLEQIVYLTPSERSKLRNVLNQIHKENPDSEKEFPPYQRI
jgi:hypothetical protein